MSISLLPSPAGLSGLQAEQSLAPGVQSPQVSLQPGLTPGQWMACSPPPSTLPIRAVPPLQE